MTDDDTTLRPATTADLPELHALIERSYRGETSRAGWTHEADYVTTPRTDRATLSAVLADPRERLTLAVRDGEIIGCFQLSDQGAGVAYVGLVTVDPQIQAGGLGKRLLAAAEDDARQRLGARTMELSVVSIRETLIAYYVRRGYAATGEFRAFPVATEQPLMLQVMAKAL